MEKNKGKHIVPLVYNKVFIQCFYHNNGIKRLEYLVSDCLNIEYEKVKGNIKLLPRDLKNDSNMSALTQVDFLLMLEGKTVNIEINRNIVPAIFNRNLVYAGKILATKYKVGDAYQTIDAVIQININNFKTNKEKIVEKYMLYAENSKEIFSDNLKIYNIDITKGIKKEYKYEKEEERIVNWCKLFVDQNSYTFEQTCDKIFSKEESKEFVKIMEELSNENEIIRLEGETDEVILNTIKRGARESGHKEGLEEGIEQEKLEIAKNLLNLKIDINSISKSTGLSIEKLNKLKEEK